MFFAGTGRGIGEDRRADDFRSAPKHMLCNQPAHRQTDKVAGRFAQMRENPRDVVRDRIEIQWPSVVFAQTPTPHVDRHGSEAWGEKIDLLVPVGSIASDAMDK